MAINPETIKVLKDTIARQFDSKLSSVVMSEFVGAVVQGAWRDAEIVVRDNTDLFSVEYVESDDGFGEKLYASFSLLDCVGKDWSDIANEVICPAISRMVMDIIGHLPRGPIVFASAPGSNTGFKCEIGGVDRCSIAFSLVVVAYDVTVCVCFRTMKKEDL